MGKRQSCYKTSFKNQEKPTTVGIVMTVSLLTEVTLM